MLRGAPWGSFFGLCVFGLCAGLLGCGSGPEPVLDGGPDAAEARCEQDRDCDDGVFCNGLERCRPDAMAAAPNGCVPGAAPCPGGRCDEAARVCSVCENPDFDGDGSRALGCGGDDCDDEDSARRPGGVEVCDPDGRDEDCDPRTVGMLDVDGDGATDARCCNDDVCGSDCDDARADVRPGMIEACNERDDDCDGALDEGVLRPFYVDGDRDLYGARDAEPVWACAAPDGYANNAFDCNDEEASVRPGMIEACNGRDDDCNDVIDDEASTQLWCQATFGSPAYTVMACEAGSCRIASCTVGYENCNDRLDDGCETRITDDPRHCGACGRACGLGGVCTEGACDAVRSLEAGANHACLVREGGAMVCWGANHFGQLGDGTARPWSPPVLSTTRDAERVMLGSGFNVGSGALTTNRAFTCAVSPWRIRCVGANDVGQVGDGTLVHPRLDPQDVLGVPGTSPGVFGQVIDAGAGGEIACAIASGYFAFGPPPSARTELRCWGGQIWAYQSPQNPTPYAVNRSTPPLGDASRLFVGGAHLCVVPSPPGPAFCAGDNVAGQLGNGTAGTIVADFVQVLGPTNWVQLSGSYRGTCGLTADRRVYCWGDNTRRQIDSSMSNRPSPVEIPFAGLLEAGDSIAEVDAESYAVCARTERGRVFCWGAVIGTVGTWTPPPVFPPREVTGFGGAVVDIALGHNHACALRDDGRVLCWGKNDFGQLGVPPDEVTSSDTPQLVRDR